MADLIDFDASRIRVELGGGVVVAAADDSADVPAVLVRMPAARAHALAHLLDDWTRAFGLVPDDDLVPSDAVLRTGWSW